MPEDRGQNHPPNTSICTHPDNLTIYIQQKMEPIMPYDKSTAEQVLRKFIKFAIDIKFKPHFLKAVEILYGSSYVIKIHASGQMYFYCCDCSKEVNNYMSLEDHSNSGTHLKNVDFESSKKIKLGKNPNDLYFRPDSLQYKIYYSTIPIVGCQMVECYDIGRSVYHKCILCGAHGKVDAMYHHLIGDKHTDKYIRSRIVLNSPTISASERSYFRQEISQLEKFDARDVRTIQGKSFYPYKWQAMGKSNRSRHTRETSVEQCSPSLNTVKTPSSPKTVEEDVSQTTVELSPTSSNQELDKLDKGIQCYSYAFLENVLLKLNTIVHTHTSTKADNDLHSIEDLKQALNLLNYCLHLLYYVNRNQLMDSSMTPYMGLLKEQKQVTESCLGYVFYRLLPYFKSKYGSWRYDTS